jgi:hypothetical protein
MRFVHEGNLVPIPLDVQAPKDMPPALQKYAILLYPSPEIPVTLEVYTREWVFCSSLAPVTRGIKR